MLFLINLLTVIIISTSPHYAKTSRTKRHLELAKGSTFTVTLAMSTFLPKDIVPEKIPTGLAHITEFDLIYHLPERLTFVSKNKKHKFRPVTTPKPMWNPEFFYYAYPDRRRKTTRRRGKFLDQVSRALESEGLGGDECIERLACEARHHLRPNRSLMEHLITSVVSAATNSFNDRPCHSFSCPVSLLQMIMNAEPLEIGPQETEISPT